ncbi:Hypothetical predicted protein [Xyrichtys novacula]|uniref:Uncharacterized protein n=1 Tax=Xyrichtys novacula TaxID=13765 RepID=A0AAV1GLC6_XYRNO|nr:Hypothetical predicted protein [Xyrichtys novacula]
MVCRNGSSQVAGLLLSLWCNKEWLKGSPQRRADKGHGRSPRGSALATHPQQRRHDTPARPHTLSTTCESKTEGQSEPIQSSQTKHGKYCMKQMLWQAALKMKIHWVGNSIWVQDD